MTAACMAVGRSNRTRRRKNHHHPPPQHYQGRRSSEVDYSHRMDRKSVEEDNKIAHEFVFVPVPGGDTNDNRKKRRHYSNDDVVVRGSSSVSA